MQRLFSNMIRHKRIVTIVFIVVAAVCSVMILGVSVNYNMVDYLPANAQSTKTIAIMDEEFTQSVPNARAMVHNVSIQEALEYKDKLAKIDGVTEVLWLDDIVDIMEPLEVGSQETIEGYYKDNTALYSISIASGEEVAACAAIRELIGEENALSGDAADEAAAHESTTAEVANAVVILVPSIIAILIISTTSWMEPILFLFAIGVSILINMGTNIFLGEVSFITQSVSPILQLAISLDYAIFLLHSFGSFRKKYADVDVAMKHAMRQSLSTVAASAATTLFGFLALVFMDFEIGADLGINLAKGIVLSFISVMIFLPALTLSCYKLIDKTRHRKFLPSFKNSDKLFSRLRVPALVIIILIAVPCFLGQSQTDFIYGMGASNSNDRSGQETTAINEEFGQSTIIVILVPRGDMAKEQLLCEDLENLNHVTAVVSYSSSVGTVIPEEFLDTEITSQFYSEHYARIILYADTPSEGDMAFALVEAVNEVASEYYGDEFYLAGQSANLYDMKNVVQADNIRVNLIAIIAIFLVLLITFKSGLLPFILLITIEAGIWINLAIPYFSSTSINFIGYLVVNTVQLGATVDYAILFTNHYMRNRRQMLKGPALHRSMGETFKSILVSASILALAGFTLFGTSSNPIVSELGLMIGRGAVFSMILVVCFLPALLYVFDKAIAKTTYKPEFYAKDIAPKLKKSPKENQDEVKAV